MRKKVLLFGLIGFLLFSCKTTYLKQSTNVSNVKKSYDKILMVSRSKDKTARIKAETQMAQELKNRGVNAEPAFDVIRTESFSKEITEGELESMIQDLVAKGFTGIVVTNLINAQEYTDVIPGSASTGYYPARYGRFGRYYSYYPATYWEPDRVETGIEYTVESCLYDITVQQEDNLQWVGRFQIKNPSDLMTVIERYSAELAEELIAQSVQP